MRKWIISGIVVVVLAVAAAAALLNLNYLVARNRGYLIEQAEQALGRKISVSDVQGTIFTGLGVRLTNFAISDDPAYSPDDFVRAKDLQVNVKFWPLLRKEVEVKRIILREPVIRIIRNSQGSFNFSTLTKSSKAKTAAAEKKTPPSPSEAEGPLGLIVNLVDISVCDISYIDRKEGGDLHARHIDLKVEEIDSDRRFSVNLAAALYADKQNVELSGKVGPLGAGENFDDVPVDGAIAVDPLNLSRLTQALPQLKSALPKELEFSGLFRVKKLGFRGSLKDLAVNGEFDGSDGVVRYGKSFHKPAGIPLIVNADTRYTGQKLSISKGRVKLHGLELANAGDIQLGESTVLNLAFNSRPASLDGWDKVVPALASYRMTGTMEIRGSVRGKVGKGAVPQIEGILGLKNASARPPDFPKPIENLDTQIRFTGQRADIGDMSLSLGNSRIRLAAAVEKFAPLTVTYKMSAPEIWPADYKTNLPEERKGDVIRNLRSEGRFTMRGDHVVYDGTVTSADGTLYDLAYKGLDASLSVADKVANVRSLRVNLLKGSLHMAGECSFREQAPRFSATTKVNGIDIKELYAFLDPKAEHDIRGRMNGEMKLAGNGQTWEAIKPTLHGEGTTEVLQGALLNFNIAEGTLSGITGIPGLTDVISPALRKKYPETFTAKDTEFNELRANFDVGEGKANVKNLRVSAAEFIVQGYGWVDFTRRIDFPATLMFSQRLSADLGQSAREVKYFLNKQGQLEIPLKISGRLPNVKPKPDLKFLGQLAQRGFLQKGVEEFQSRYLGRNESSREESAPGEARQKRRNSTEDAIRRGIESFFKR
jgi:AsmA protein